VVIEFLTFDVAAHERDAWLAADRDTWTAYLSNMPGFVRKELWVDRDHPDQVHAAIWWQDDASWDECDLDAMLAVDAAMGALHRRGTCRAFDVVG
jgi:uncharacterized protein (TIGR03792 family)